MRAVGWLVLFLTACAPIRRRVDGAVVRRVSFDGNGGWFSGHGDYQLAEQMQQQETLWGALVWPFVYTVDPVLLDRDLLRTDAYRLEVWYAHHGWFDARVDGWQIRELRRPTERKASVVDVWGLVEPGPRSTVRAITVEGLSPSLAASALRRAPQQEGAPFDLDLVTATRELLLQRLLNEGYAYATVEAESTAVPAEQAVDVTLQATPGIVGTIGSITVEGEQKVPERHVREVLDLETGDPYSLDALRNAQRRLFQLGTFSVATVEPDLRDPTLPQVPLQVRVTESRFRTFRAGGGFVWDSYVPVVQASARIQHVNLLRQLIRADLGAFAGLAFDLSRGFSFESRIPIWGVDLNLQYPRVLGQRGSLELNADIEQDVYTGLWEYRRPLVDLALVYKFSDKIQGRIGPHFEDYTFIGGLAGGDLSVAQQRLFGITDSSLRYQLTALDQYLTVDGRDNPIRATRGGYLQVAFREAVPLSESGFGFVRGTFDARRYLYLGGQRDTFPLTLAGRIGGTLVTPYGDTTQIPLPERAFLGGSTGLRGFRPRQVGPYTTLCTYPNPDTPVVRYDIPRGGNVAAQAGVEGRYDATSSLTLASSFEVGALADDLGTLGADDLRFSFGPGLRYDTPVGPLRFDLSFRPLYPEDSGPLSYDGACEDVDRLPRVFDFFSQFNAYSGENAGRHPGFAMVFYLTFGEAL